jgi:hypothetical protein
MKRARFAIQLASLGLLVCTISHAQVGDGVANDTTAIQNIINAAKGKFGTAQLPCVGKNLFKVTRTIQLYPGVKLVSACGAVPDEGSSTTVGATLLWAGPSSTPVVSFHAAAGASMSSISVDCNSVAAAIGILYDSNDKPAASFVNIDNLMIKGCHQGLVVGVANETPLQTVKQCEQTPLTLGCYEADQLKFERYRILGNLADLAGEGIHINSANAAQGSLISDGNIQGVNRGIHIVMTNGGLLIQSSNMGSQVGPNPTFIQIEPTVALSPTLINDEVEAPTGTNAYAVVDHACNPGGVPGTPVWLYNMWNSYPTIVDGCESITSIGNVSTNGSINSSAAHVLSLNEVGWNRGSGVATGSLTTLASGVGNFGDTVQSQNYLAALAPNCPSPSSFQVVPQPGDLVSCESMHGGRLFLGQDLMLLNNGDGTLDTAGLMRIQTGLYQDGSGLKHQTMSTGAVAASGTVQLSFVWTTAFADPNYQAVCTAQDTTGSLQVLSTTPPAPNVVNVFVKNTDSTNAHTGTLACFAIHN